VVGTTSIETLFRAHWGLVSGYLQRRTGDRALAEDLAQETFLRATRAFLGWRGGRPEAWLLTIARNVLIDHVRTGKPTVQIDEELVAGNPGADPASNAAVRDALRRIPETQARLLTLIHVDGFTHAEVAAMAGSTPAAIKTAVWRAREVFKHAYQEEDDEQE
jgi:RNA polymerase sigma factor (sigma-70 family)